MRPLFGTLLALGLLTLGAYLALEAGWVRFNHPSEAEFPVRGIDVSHHQGAIDWAAVARDGVDFAYIKATEGGDFRDPRFTENWAAARAAGLEVGAYHFFTFCRDVDDQVENLLAVLPEGAALPPALDVEFGGNCALRVAPAVIRARVLAFLDRVEAARGVRPIVYVTEEARVAILGDAAAHERLWVRDVFGRPEGPWAMWQYANRGRVAGIDGPVDLNVAMDEPNAERTNARCPVSPSAWCLRNERFDPFSSSPRAQRSGGSPREWSYAISGPQPRSTRSHP